MDYDDSRDALHASSYVLRRDGDTYEGEESDQIRELDIYINHRRRLYDDGPAVSRAACTNLPKSIGEQEYPHLQIKSSIDATEPYCHVKLDSVMKLKDSTKKLLSLLGDIHAKTPGKHPSSNLIATNSVIDSVTDFCASALKRLESQTRVLDSWPAPYDDDDCSIYKRLTRKCNCLNQQEYNDFIIHFNEQAKYSNNTQGEIIKNLRILKRFLYMGGGYTKNALMFLNEGLKDSTYSEKVEITQGCAYADICNVFEDATIAITCIAWPYKYDTYGDSVTQELAASFIFKLAQLEEGRRYLKLSSKLTSDIKKILRKKGMHLDYNTLEMLNAILSMMHPIEAPENRNDIISCRPIDEGFATQTMKTLINYRKYMTLGEIFVHLDLINKLSTEEKSREELEGQLNPLLMLFKNMLLVHDDSEMNIIIINILNNIITPKVLKLTNKEWPRMLPTAEAANDPIPELNENMGHKKSLMKTKKSVHIKSKHILRKFIREDEKQELKWKEGIHPPPLQGRRRRHQVPCWDATRLLNIPTLSDKHAIIVVPLEKSKRKK